MSQNGDEGEPNILTMIDEGIQHTQLLHSARIYRVPEILLNVNKTTYTPRVVAIGPLHCNDKHLQTPIVHVKKYYTRYLLDRVKGGSKANELLQKCLGEINKHSCDANNYYADDVKLDMKMMVFDGCFILELLFNAYKVKMGNGEDSGNSKAFSSIPQPVGGEGSSDQKKRKKSGDGSSQISGSIQGKSFDPITDNILTSVLVKYDLLLLENQIPFFILQNLFELTIATIPDNKLSLEDYVLSYFRNIIGLEKEKQSGSKTTCLVLPGDSVVSVGRYEKESEDDKGEKSGKANQYYHILHLLHDNCLPDQKGKNRQMNFPEVEVSASELHYAGVNFAPAEEKNLFNVKFDEPSHILWWFQGAKFQIPHLIVDDSTELVLRNLIALEQCCPGVDRYFTSYAKFMDMLINSKKDVEVLRKSKVIRNNLGADVDISRLFNKLCKEIVVGEFYFSEQYQDACNYSNLRWPKLMLYWKSTYFASPWKFKAACGGVLAFGILVTKFIRGFLN